MKTAIICSASEIGLSAILTQYCGDIPKLYENPKIIAHASRSLTPVEVYYAQTDRESLAVLFGCIKFEQYVKRTAFTVVTDHQPLVTLFNSPVRPGPFRVERIRQKLVAFKFIIAYKSGKWNPSVDHQIRPIKTRGSSRSRDGKRNSCGGASSGAEMGKIVE